MPVPRAAPVRHLSGRSTCSRICRSRQQERRRPREGQFSAPSRPLLEWLGCEETSNRFVRAIAVWHGRQALTAVGVGKTGQDRDERGGEGKQQGAGFEGGTAKSRCGLARGGRQQAGSPTPDDADDDSRKDETKKEQVPPARRRRGKGRYGRSWIRCYAVLWSFADRGASSPWRLEQECDPKNWNRHRHPSQQQRMHRWRLESPNT